MFKNGFNVHSISINAIVVRNGKIKDTSKELKFSILSLTIISINYNPETIYIQFYKHTFNLVKHA